MKNTEVNNTINEMIKDLRGDILKKLNELKHSHKDLTIEVLFRNAAAIVLQSYVPSSKVNRIAYAV